MRNRMSLWLLGIFLQLLPSSGLVGDGLEAQTARTAPHQLRPIGRTLVEAEDYTTARANYPYAESCRSCSGQKNLGYFWKDAWFDLQIDVPRSAKYDILIRSSSLKGTKIEISMIDAQGNTPSRRAVDVPKTGDYLRYVDAEIATMDLLAGVQTIRFKNLEVDAANIDYVTFCPWEVNTHRPAATDGPRTNPLKGFNTGWWRNEDYASVGFQYIEWGKFEPIDDQFDWNYVEDVIDRKGSQGRHLISQFVVDWNGYEPIESNYLGPKWLLERVGENHGPENPDDPASRIIRATRYDHPDFIEEAGEAIRALVNRYRDDPRTFVLQVGVLGFWGEWHTFPRFDWSPSDETKSKILAFYRDSLGPDGLTQIRYPLERIADSHRGTGYTNGSATLTDHGKEFGDQIAERKLWKQGPVGGEWPPNVEDSLWQQFFQTSAGMEFIKRGHYSTLLPPEPKELTAKLPGWKLEGHFLEMHRQMGYQFRVKEVRQLKTQNHPGRTYFEVLLHNDGIAPFYKRWNVQLGILPRECPEAPAKIIDVNTDLREVGPGETITLKGYIEELDHRQNYQLALRICQPRAETTKPKPWPLKARHVYVVLANDLDVIEGAWDPQTNGLQGGWNILSEIEREKPRLGSQDLFPMRGSFRPPIATD